MNTAELRQAFLDFFAERGHEVVASSSLVPGNDPTLLFTNAGMVQFKDVFLGKEKRGYTRAASSQRCVRAGGKHNDLENVGYTARHHTFFEMLGNFSFGDYFKEEAIRFGWEFLTDVLGLPAERLWVTVYEDDEEAADIWLNTMGVSAERFSRLGEKDNFWSMGDTGPCGPCSEIFYDHGPDVPGGPPGSPDEDGDRYVEVWNLVFMQFNRDADGSQTDLPKPSVDTGMGLERIAAVMQGVHSNYDIDLFARLIDAVCEVTGCEDRSNPSLRVIADHIRASAFLIIDGVVPSNEGRGYVLRRIIRRALRHGHQLGVSDLFFHRLVAPLVALMGEAYPELKAAEQTTANTLEREEERFAQTLSQGMSMLEDAIAGLDGKVIPGDVVFKLYDTYGFPVDLTADIARERNLSIDHAGFESSMNAQRERARAASKFGVDQTSGISSDACTEFQGYDGTAGDSVVTELFRGEESVDALNAGDDGVVIVERTPFYAESGGQVGDQGELIADGLRFVVRDTQKFGSAFGHVGVLEEGTLRVGAALELNVDRERRQAIVLNHSATHLLHAALRSELGDHVTQKGSLVAPERLRFDFSHTAPLSDDQLERIEDLVNEQIRLNAPAETRLMQLEEAMESGAMSLFGEKYDAEVRVLRLGEFSIELCGGTHVERAGDIGLFKIVAETGIAAGVRRIEAITGAAALAHLHHNERLLRSIGQKLKAGRDEIDGRVEQVIARNRAQDKELDELKQKLLGSRSTDLAADAQDINGLKVLAVRMDGADARAMRGAVDTLKDRLGRGVVVIGAADGDKVRLVAGVTANATDLVKAGALVAMVAEQVGGRGGGRADMAQAGGNDPTALDAALDSVADWVRDATG